jgi:hypothetical protein
MAMRRRYLGNAFVRCLAIVFLAAGLVGAAVRPAKAQDESAVAIVAGSCAAPGEVAADLRPLKAAEGGAQTSFTTIDLAIDELTGGGYAVVVGAPNAPAACGELAGEGTDVYVAVTSRDAAGLGGVAWLHARGERTQVSLFVGAGLGAASDQPEPPSDETPAPTKTPKAAAATATYASPNYGYTVTYDTKRWKVGEESSTPLETGPYDYFVLDAGGGRIHVEISGLTLAQDPPATEYLQVLANILNGDSHRSQIATRTDADGNPIEGGDETHAFVATTYLYTTDDGDRLQRSQYLECWQLPEPGTFLVLGYTTDEVLFDDWMPEIEKLRDGITFPDE